MRRTKKIVAISALVMTPIVVALAVWLVHALWVADKTVKFMSAFEAVHAKPPLSITQVEQILGQPLQIEHAESTGITGDVYHYPTYPPGGDFKVIFVNGVVFNTALAPYPAKS